MSQLNLDLDGVIPSVLSSPSIPSISGRLVEQTPPLPEWGCLLSEGYADLPPAPLPKFIELTNGDKLLMPGELAFLAAPAGTGKTTIALAVCLQAVRAGRKVLYLDLEQSFDGTQRKLEQLGAIRREAACIKYLPVERNPLYLTDRLIAEADAFNATLIVCDSFSRLAAVADLDDNRNIDVLRLNHYFLRPVYQNTGAAFLVLDHTGHGNQRHNRGGSAKIDICQTALLARTAEPFDRSREGSVDVITLKASAGHLAAHRPCMTVRFRPLPGGRIEVIFDSPTDRPRKARKDNSDRVLAALKQAGAGASTNAVHAACSGLGAATVKATLEALLERGLVQRQVTARGWTTWSVVNAPH